MLDILPSEAEYIKQQEEVLSAASNPVVYICPKCGGQVRKEIGMVMMSNPPKYYYYCLDCDYDRTGL